MCGIIGYVGSRASKPLLLAGLERLEYSGYDSAGIALVEADGIDYVRAVGNLQFLKDKAGPNGSQSRDGARPHALGDTRRRHRAERASADGCDERKLAIVLNGIVENYRELRAELESDGHSFSSETDAEVVAHLLETRYDGDLVEAVRAVYPRLEGHFTFVLIHADHPDHLVGIRHQTPLVVGLGDGENFLASNLAAFLARDAPCAVPRRRRDRLDHARRRHGPWAPSTADRSSTTSSRSTGTTSAAERSGYETFMLKEIYEQPEGVAETIGDRVRHGRLVLEGLGLSDDELRGCAAS